jgi:hypothetical protein
MKFIGDINYSFNEQLLPLLHDTLYTIVSYVNGDYSYETQDDNVIQLLAIDEVSYYKSIDMAYTKMIQNGFYDTLKTCTSIFIVQPNLVDVEVVAKIINEFDRNNLVDNIWIYPNPVSNYVMRNNEVAMLPYQNQTK